jgi:haloalkane dehalogenase
VGAVKILRTPEERFRDLPGYPFAPRYVEVGPERLRMHYLDEGERQAPVVLLLHGEPTWSFLYRKMIPPLVAAGRRVVAPDLVGFGRSDKPAERSDYSYQRHVAWTGAFVEALELERVTLFCQDWGGLIGLRLCGEPATEARFARVVAANTFLPTGDEPVREAFLRWRRLSQREGELDIGRVVSDFCPRPLAPEVKAAYDAPFPDESYKAGARAFPMLVPTSPDDPASPANRAAWERLGRWHKPFLTVFGDGDPITRGSERALQRHIPGCAGQPHVVIEGAGHFLQEDAGERVAEILASFVSS